LSTKFANTVAATVSVAKEYHGCSHLLNPC